ncbi:MAG TPA: hypothetical protein VD962_04165 [Rubricoccaceae bacterium]|nr:hypothetical protein [Rubricoccaceae bacterium]
MRACLPLAFAILLAACDGGNDGGPDLSYFVGSWTLVGVEDDTGDRTADLDSLLDAMTVSFTAAGAFTLLVDYTQAVNDGGTADATINGTYDLASDGRLILSTTGAAAQFGVVRRETEMDLSGSALVLNQILDTTVLDVGLMGTVVLTLARD